MVAGENASGSGGHGCSGVRRSRRNKRQSGQGSTSTAAGAALSGASVTFRIHDDSGLFVENAQNGYRHVLACRSIRT